MVSVINPTVSQSSAAKTSNESSAGNKGGIPAAGPCIAIIFGASGDLTKRKLIPALYNLVQQKLLPEQFSIVGIGRTPMPVEDFKHKIINALREFATGEIEEQLIEWLAPRLHYLSGDFKSPETYQQLKDTLTHIDQERNTQGNYLYYLATAPTFFDEIN